MNFTTYPTSFLGSSSAEQIQLQFKSANTFVDSLPPGFLHFEEFAEKFQLEGTSTEQLHPLTKALSQTMHKNVEEGLEQLVKADEKVIEGLETFIPTIKSVAPVLAKTFNEGGRVFLLGSGSSGRVAVDIAAKCSQSFPKYENQCIGLIAGGDSALVKAREGFEDSESDGMKALEGYHVGLKDVVILISASGSASFNVGCGHFAANHEAKVFYFYNSQKIPSRTQQLFDRKNNPVTPLCVDIGPQAISGSTRLQGATLAEADLGALLTAAFYLSEGKEDLAANYPKDLAIKLQEGIQAIRCHFKHIAKFIDEEREVFSNPSSNFRQVKDVTNQGYVTFIALEDSIREVLIDSTESSPTFSTNPIRRENESHKKQPEFCAYLAGESNNLKAWQALVGRNIHEQDIKNTGDFLLACEAEGMNSYQKRPLHKGNFLVGIAKLDVFQPIPEHLKNLLKNAKSNGVRTGILLICKGKLPNLEEELYGIDHVLVMENTPFDSIGFAETIILKQTLNLISNGSMILMNKVNGNRMIDVRASNNKLIDRCMRLIKDIWADNHDQFSLTDKELYHYVVHVSALKKQDEEKGIYTPSIVKIVLAMIYLKKTPKDFQEVVNLLAKKEERIDWIAE